MVPNCKKHYILRKRSRQYFRDVFDLTEKVRIYSSLLVAFLQKSIFHHRLEMTSAVHFSNKKLFLFLLFLWLVFLGELNRKLASVRPLLRALFLSCKSFQAKQKKRMICCVVWNQKYCKHFWQPGKSQLLF